MKFKLIIIFLLFSTIIFAQKNSLELAKAQEQINTYGDVYFKFPVKEKADIEKLPNFISKDNFDENNKMLYAYVPKTKFEALQTLKIPFEVVPKGKNTKALTMANTVGEMVNWDRYPTYSVYQQMMQDFATDYPDICRIENIGSSQEGRDILVLKISDNPDDAEDEPEFFYTGQMHGDELIGQVILLRFADYLLSNYGSDSQVDELVNGIEIFINPLSNPDGLYNGGDHTVSGATRYLANGVDANRNFPAPDNDHPDGQAWASETVVMMDFADDHDINLSSNIHSGAVVVNYPWDTWTSSQQTHADDNWWQFVSHEYADTAQANSSGYMTGFNDGITNGGDWYTIDGGRQDYMTYFMNGREFTLELTGSKFVDAEDLPTYWNYNYNSLLLYMKQALYGVRGIVTDATTGNPIKAKIEVVGHDDDNSFIYSSLPQGNYHRLIYEGNYTINVSAPCYDSQIINNVSVTNFQTTLLDVQLVLSGFSSGFETDNTNVQLGESIDFTDISCGNITSWEWTFEGGTPNTSNDQNPTNITYNEIGTFDVSLTISDGTNTDTVTINDYISVDNEFIMENTTVSTCQGIFYDSGGDTGSYRNNENYIMTFLPEESYGKVICDFLPFNMEYHNQCYYDWLKIYDGENTSSVLIGTYCGNDSPGQVVASNVSGALTFEFYSDSSQTDSGWEALISCDNSASIDSIDLESLKLFPNPIIDTNAKLSFKNSIQNVRVTIFDSLGKKVLSTYKNEIGAGESIELTTNEFKAGIYIIQIATNKTSVSKKLIKL